MKSPITGKEMKLTHEMRAVNYRKETLEIPYQFYLCEDTKEQFTTSSLDDFNLALLHNAYRAKYNLPFPDEIKNIRTKYDLSASRIAEILGFGTNVYRKYENGEVPSLSNARLIQTIENPASFAELLERWEAPDEPIKEKVTKRVQRLVIDQELNRFSIDFDNYLMGEEKPDEFTGYCRPSMPKLTEMVVFFSSLKECYKTKMNKLLFYSDFEMYRKHGQSISGTRYRAIPYGPVPEKYQSIFDKLSHMDEVDMFYQDFDNGARTEYLAVREDRPFNKGLFSEAEIEVLQKIKTQLGNKSTRDIVQLSHKESAWSMHKHDHSLINYHFAFDLQAVK